MSAACIFCSIVAGSLPSRRVYEDEHTVAFLDISPATRGHTLVVPREHTSDLWTASAESVAAVARTTLEVARLIRERLDPAGITVVQANGAAAGQEVFHLHTHVVPRYPGDSVRAPWQPTPASDVELDDVMSVLGSSA